MDWSVLLTRERRKRDFILVVTWALVCFTRRVGAQDFRIDNQLRIQANDCYTRIAIGSRMPDSAVTSTIPVNTLSDCEVACSGNRTICNGFSFGIDTRGNGTCRLGRMDLNTRGNDLVMDPDYDVYERRAKMPRGCQHDRLLRIGFGVRVPTGNTSTTNSSTVLSRQQVIPPGNVQGTTMTTTPGQAMPNGARRPPNPFGSPFFTGTLPGNDSPREPSFFRGGWYAPIADDGDSRLYDIINNKKNYKSHNSNQWKQTHHENSQYEHYPVHHHAEFHPDVGFHLDHGHHDYSYRSGGPEGVQNKWNGPGSSDENSKWNEDAPGFNSKWTEGRSGSNSKWNVGDSGLNWNEDIPGFNSKWNEDLPGFTSKWNEGFGDFGDKWNDKLFSSTTTAPIVASRGVFDQSGGLGLPAAVADDPILQKTKSCYRKLLSGRRLADGHVRRNVQCSRIEECHRVCEYETTFVCEGFNYGRVRQVSTPSARQGDRSYMCQLTSLSGSRMDLRRDFVHDPSYDFYERDWRCPAEKPSHGVIDWSLEDRRPAWHPPPPPPPPRRPPNNEPARPLHPHGNKGQRPNDRYPVVPVVPGTGTRYYLPEKARPPIGGPGGYDYYSGSGNYLPLGPPRPQNEIVHYHRPHQPPQPPPYLPNPGYYYPPAGPSRNGIYTKFSDRRMDQSGWQRPQLESRPNEVLPDRDWRRPGGSFLPNKDWPEYDVYGPSYGYDSNKYDGRFPSREPDRRPGNFYPSEDKKPQRRPAVQQDYYGYRYGPAYGYDAHRQHDHRVDSYVPSWKPQVQSETWLEAWGGGSRDCSVRSATGFKLNRRIVDSSYTAGNLEECEMLCATRGDCQSFAYRYSLAATSPTDNCLLSAVSFSKLDFYTDLVPDRDYDIYAIISDLRNCEGSRKPSTEARPHHRPSEECFWRVRSGFGIPVSLTRKELRVDNGLGECQIACVSARQFTCRSFVFRYESDRDRGPNCFLSDCPTSEIIPGEGAGLPRIDQAELYERGSYGRGCEPYPFATILNPSNFDKRKPWSGGSNHVANHGDEGCYSGYQGGCRLSPYAVSSITRVDSENECRRKCSRMRNNPHMPCMSFSFKIGDEKRGDNCYLSDVPRRDLRPGLDYVYDDDYVMYAWKELEPQCLYQDQPHGIYDDPAEAAPGSWSGGDSSSGRPPPPLGPGTGFLSYNHLVLGVRPLDLDSTTPHDFSIHSSTPQNDDGYFYGLGSPYPDGHASFNRHYTVNGLPCKRGTKCERNELVGFWSCEPEGSELGSWDYCCEPNHHCGFSQGYRYPWCYVGPSEDQWRPCSDRYFPYLPSPRPAVKPNGHRPPTYQHSDNEDSTTYNSRHWPIAFLHPQPPPNATDSVALADDRRDDPKRTNTSREHTSANKTRAPPVEVTNSPITRLQLHKSHLKRRGLVSANRSALLSKNGVKKIRRITIIPAGKNMSADSATEAPPYGAKYTVEKMADTKESAGYYNGTKSPRSQDGGFQVIHLAAALQDVGVAKKRKGNLGRVERVTKPTVATLSEFEARGSKNARRNFLKDSDAVSGFTEKRPVYMPVALTIHAENDSSREV